MQIQYTLKKILVLVQFQILEYSTIFEDSTRKKYHSSRLDLTLLDIKKTMLVQIVSNTSPYNINSIIIIYNLPFLNSILN